MTMSFTGALRRFRYTPVLLCESEVTRDWESDACGKPAVSASRWPEDNDDFWYPTCAYHTRKATAVPIRALLHEAWREGHQATPDTTNPYDGGTR